MAIKNSVSLDNGILVEDAYCRVEYPIKQAYLYLKSLEKYEDAEDC